MATSTMETLRWYKKMLDAGNRKPGLLLGIAHTLGFVIEYMKLNRWHDLQKNPSDLPEDEDVQVLVALADGQNGIIYDIRTGEEIVRHAADPDADRKIVGWRLFDKYEKEAAEARIG